MRRSKKTARPKIAKPTAVKPKIVKTKAAKATAAKTTNTKAATARGVRRDIAQQVRIKRAYEPPSSEDGTRILVDRLWPRGISKAHAHIAQWMKEIAPSN